MISFMSSYKSCPASPSLRLLLLNNAARRNSNKEQLHWTFSLPTQRDLGSWTSILNPGLDNLNTLLMEWTTTVRSTVTKKDKRSVK